jgi:hypothetical protein
MVSKVVREVFIDYDNFSEYDADVMHYLAGCKTTGAGIMIDFMEKFFKRRNGKPIPVLYYLVSVDTEYLLWIKLSAPEIILKEVSISL